MIVVEGNPDLKKESLQKKKKKKAGSAKGAISCKKTRPNRKFDECSQRTPA